MNKFVYFLAVGLAFTALQVATVEAAEDCMSHPAGSARAACEAGGGDGGPDCEAMGAPGSAARTMCEDGKGHDGPPPIDPRTGAPFTEADMATYQIYIDECEATQGVLSEGSISVLIVPPHNFTRVQVEKLCREGGDHPPGNHPPGNHPPGNHPPGQHPPGQHPPGQHPPGQHPEIDTSHCDQFEGAPKAACIAAAESGPPGGDECANEETPALVAACVARKTAAGN